MSFQNHKCQIDCTNHDEVINKLEVKSKDLYYFWVILWLLREIINGCTISTTINLRWWKAHRWKSTVRNWELSMKDRNNIGSGFKNMKWSLLIFKERFKISNIKIDRFNRRTSLLKVNWEIFKGNINLFLKKLILFRFKSSVKNNRFLNFKPITNDKLKG